jgi:hypothetical protein
MHSRFNSHPNVSHLVDLPLEAAAAAFDVMILDPALTDALIPAGALVKARPVRYDALRRLPAVLRLGPRRRTTMSVVLELLPWSDHRSDLAIHSVDRSWMPIGRSVERYRIAAEHALDVLARLMESRPTPPDRRLSAWIPSAGSPRHGRSTLGAARSADR